MKRLLCTAIFVFLFSLSAFAVDYPVSAGEWSTIFATASYTYDGLENGETHTLSSNVAGGNLVSSVYWSIVSASSNAAHVDVTFSNQNVQVFAQNDITGPVVITANIRVSFRAQYDLSQSPFSVFLKDAGDAGNLGFTESDIYHIVSDIRDSMVSALSYSDFLGQDALVYFDDRYFSNAWISGAPRAPVDGYYPINASDTGGALYREVDGSRVVSFVFTPGDYLVAWSVPGDITNVTLNSGLYSSYDLLYRSIGSGSTILIYRMHVTSTVSPYEMLFSIEGTPSSGYLGGGIARYPEDASASAAVPDEWEDTNQQLDSAASDLHSVDETVFTDINTYKGQLDFGLDSWSDAAAGLSYVGNIFLILWDNIPTQPIVLALMLGLASLLLGRGAALARRAGRGRGGGDDDA